ncbi:MAG: hypothetical protein JNL01_03410 [Bdellovibrionales bacterium]|nr:hypothetical protein [Bdellovibrionales bacterium]
MPMKIWERIWFSKIDPEGLKYFRWAIGGLFFFIFLGLAPNWIDFYGSNGIQSFNGEGRFADQDPIGLFYVFDHPFFLWGFWAAGLAASVLLLWGRYTRAAILALFLLEVSMIHRNRFVCNGEDLVLRMLLFYALFLPLEFKKGVLKKDWPDVWPLRLMQINVAAIYVFSLPAKFAQDPTWLTGDLMYYALNNSMWSRWPWPSMTYNGILSKLMTYTALVAEISFPILVWFKKTRLSMVFLMMAFHFSIGIILDNLTFFSLSMLVAFTVYLPIERSNLVSARIS